MQTRKLQGSSSHQWLRRPKLPVQRHQRCCHLETAGALVIAVGGSAVTAEAAEVDRPALEVGRLLEGMVLMGTQPKSRLVLKP